MKNKSTIYIFSFNEIKWTQTCIFLLSIKAFVSDTDVLYLFICSFSYQSVPGDDIEIRFAFY